MADLSKSLPVEGMDSTSYQADKIRRQGRIASRVIVNNHDKSLYRQYNDNNEMRDALEDHIRKLQEVKVVAGDATDQFTDKVKKKMVRGVRAMLLLNYENKAYLRMVDNFGYEAADDFKNSESDDKGMEESLKSRINETAKKFAPKTKQNNKMVKKPYNKNPNQDQFQNMPNSFLVNPLMNNMMQQQAMQQLAFQQNPMMANMMQHNMMPGFAGVNTGFRPKFYNNARKQNKYDKSKDTCKACGMIGTNCFISIFSYMFSCQATGQVMKGVKAVDSRQQPLSIPTICSLSLTTDQQSVSCLCCFTRQQCNECI